MFFKNKVAAITGGGQGRSIAMQFSCEGADVVLIALTKRQILYLHSGL